MITKLYVGNLPHHTTAEELRMLFARAGSVVSVNLIKDKNTGKSKGYAFVEMISQGDAGKAVSEFNGYRLDRQRLKVKAAKTANSSQPPKPAYVEYTSYNQHIGKSKSLRG